MNVLILGATGFLGPHVVKALSPHHRLRVTDINPTDAPISQPHEFMSVDVSSPEQVMKAAENMDAIINCSVLRHDRQLAFDVSTRGCYNMMCAAVEHGIHRIINTGPHYTITGPHYETLNYEIGPDVPPQPGTGLYAMTKALGQEICKVFTETHDIHVLCFLFYHFREHDDAGTGTDLNPFSVSWRDAGEAFRLGLEIDLADLPSENEIFMISADLPHGKFSPEKTRRILGWTPQDDFHKMWHKAEPSN